jgi:hypothetical protein
MKNYMNNYLIFIQKWYYHNKGEAKERKNRISFHINTVKEKDNIFKSDLENLKEVNCFQIYIYIINQFFLCFIFFFNFC